MANLTISTACNQDCTYCFTRDHLEDTWSNQRFLALGDFESRLSFLQRSGIDQVRLLGGEPTLHPRFLELVDQARVRNKKIAVFSNGLMSDEVLEGLASQADTKVSVLINVNEPCDAAEGILERQRIALRRLGRKAQPGFTIYRLDFKPDFLLLMVAETECRPAIRLGLAHPCLSGTNRYLHPNQYVAAGKKIVRFATAAAAAGITIEFDCGFVRCMYSAEDMATLETLGVNVAWRCSPILDVDLRGQVMHCYPLSRLCRLPLTPETDATTLRRRFEFLTHPYRKTGIFRECQSCSFKASGECSGGCLAVTIRRFRHTPFKFLISDRK
jgi:MoaA/NifB/PqqE/SkfB family radical SAM enzyme